MVAASAVGTALHWIGHHACFERVFLNSRGHPSVRWKWFARLRIANDFDRQQQPPATNVTDNGKSPKPIERGAQIAANCLDAFEKIFTFDIVEDRVPGRSGDRMRIVSKSVEKYA